MAESKRPTSKKPTAKTGNKVVKTKRNFSKGHKKETQDKILTAARHVFSNYPYHSASIRTIGKLAEIEHPLISYYFPSKADLFIFVLEEVIRTHIEAEKQMFEKIKAMLPGRALAVFLDLQLDFFRTRPEVYRIMALNMVQSVDESPIPGYHLIQESLKEALKNYTETVKVPSLDYEVDMFGRSMFVQLVSFLGAGTFHAGLLNMDPNSFQYLNWVKETVIYTMSPRLEEMFKRR